MSVFRMPSLGADMEAATLVEWRKQPGDAVHRGDILAVVETQKGAIEVEVFSDGVVASQMIAVGQTVPVGTPMAQITVPGEAPEPLAVEAPAPAPLGGVVPAAALAGAGPPPPAAGRISPAARKLAGERGISLDGLKGSGPGGVVVVADVEAAVAAQAQPQVAPPRGHLDMAAMRQAIAAAMARSKREIPHYYLTATTDLSRMLDWLDARNAGQTAEERLLLAIPLMKAVALALQGFPELNGFFTDGAFHPSKAIHIGMAISMRGGGLVAPAIHDTAQRPLDALMADMRDLVLRVRAGTLRSSELSDPTITLTSLGDRGVEALLPIIYPPQVAIVGFGTPMERPWVVEGTVRPCRVVTISLAGDHRVSDGHRGALFLKKLDQLLQTPETL